MKLTHYAAEQLVEKILNRVERDLIYEKNYSRYISVSPAIISVGIFCPWMLKRNVYRQLISKEVLESYAETLKKTIPIYTNKLELVDCYFGEFVVYKYNPENKSYRQASASINGAGILEIRVKEGLEIEG